MDSNNMLQSRFVHECDAESTKVAPINNILNQKLCFYFCSCAEAAALTLTLHRPRGQAVRPRALQMSPWLHKMGVGEGGAGGVEESADEDVVIVMMIMAVDVIVWSPGRGGGFRIRPTILRS